MTGPPIDYERLRGILASPAAATMPEALKARMTADIAQHDLEQTTSAKSDVTQVASPISAAEHHAIGVQTAGQENEGIVNTAGNILLKQPTIFAMQVAHDFTLGITPSPYGKDQSVVDPITGVSQIPIRLVSGIGTMMMEGAGLLRGLSYAGKVPIVARALEFIPGRLKEIGVGALVNGGIDALRADGLDREPNGAINDPSWLDPSAKIAKPLAELGIPDRVALGIGGSVVGGLVGSVLIGVAKGWQAGREGMTSLLNPQVSQAARDGLLRAGIDAGTEGDKYLIAKTFIKNFRRVALNQDLAAPMADQLSREAYIAQEIAQGSAELASPKSALGDLANSGFYIKPDAAVVLPNAASLQINTVEAVKQAMAKVGPEEFQNRVKAAMAQRSGDPLAQAAATEETARRIIAPPTPESVAAQALTEQDGRLIAGIFRNNPGGVNVVSGLTSDAAAVVAQERLGVKLAIAKVVRGGEELTGDVTPFYNTWEEIQNLANGVGTTRVYHGTSIENASRIVKEGIKLPQTLDEHIQSVANLYGVDPRRLKYETFGRGGLGRASYKDESVAKLSTAPAGAAQRFAGTFKYGEIPTNLNTNARMLVEAKRTGKSVTTLQAEAEAIGKAQGKSYARDTDVADLLNLPDRMSTKPGGALVELTVDNTKASEWMKQKARRVVKAVASGSTSQEQALKLWNETYDDLKVTSDMVQSTKIAMAPYIAQPTFDLLVGRPIYEYPAFEDQTIFGRLTNKVTNILKKMATEAATSVRAPRTTEAFILADGEPIRGGLNTSALVEKMRLQKPVVGGVERGDIGLREAGKFVRLELADEHSLVIDLPKALSREQFTSIGKAIDIMKFEQVTLNAGEKSIVVKTPIGAVVQDRIAELIPPKSIGSSITPEMVQQYKRSGVFAGQAAVLPDGTAAEILHKRGAAGYRVRETLTGAEFNVGAKNLTILPTALRGELQGSNLFASYMSDAERNALAKLRKAQMEGWADPITKYRDFESYANTRGYMAEQLRGGKVKLSKVNEGGNAPITFKDIPSAIEWVRKDTAPMAELANDEVTKLLGPDRNMGWIGGGGPPPRFNEIMPIDWKRMEATMESLPTDRGPGFFENLLKPMMPYLRDLDQRFGTQMYKSAYNMQTQGVARDNFLNLWYHGKGAGLPDGVKPLKQIIHEAGPKVDRELIGNWLEVAKGTPDEVDLLKSMSPQEKKAATELRAWFTAAYPALGIEAPFVEEYMPRYREAVQSGSGKSFQEFMNSIVNDPLKVPKGTDFVSDHIREGLIDTYEKDAFKVAVQYLRAGAKNRFMKQAQDEAREMVRMIADRNPNLALPLGNMLQAMGGFEFSEQRAMIKESFLGLLDRIPGGANKLNANQDLAERFTNWSTSLVYASTMGFRPSLALRNAKDVYVMAYPLYAGPRFNEAIGRALTQGGKQEAMAARAISEYAGGMLTADAQELIEKLPGWAKNLQHASTYLYDSADSFTRAGTYFAAKFKAEDALASFAKRIENIKDPKLLQKAKDQLVRDSKVYFHGDEVVDEFLRRAANSPDKAAEFAGKIASDMTNFLYGKGMQGRWMRSIGGRLMGQFGSWSMWYADYLTRMVRAVGRPEYRADALAALGRHALVNAAILSTGKFVLDVDLSRWASYGALFYSGGPGWQVAVGASTLMRGLGDASSAGEDPLAQSRISQGSQMIWHTMPAFVPFLSAGRDIYRMATPFDQTDFLAATLGTRTTKDYQARRKVDILLGDPSAEGPFQSTSPMLHQQLNNQVSGQGEQPLDVRTLPPGGIQTTGVQPPQVPEGSPTGVGASVRTQTPIGLTPLPTATPAGAKFQGQNEVRSTIEPKPSRGY